MFLVLLTCVLTFGNQVSCLTQDNGTLDSDGRSEASVETNSVELRDPKQVKEAANTMFEEYWEIVLINSPEMATLLGDHRFDDRLGSYDLKYFEKEKVMLNEFLERANQLLPLAEEGSETYFNLLLFIKNLEYQLKLNMIGAHLFPVSILNNPPRSLSQLLKYVEPKNAQDYWNLISRYRQMPRKIDEEIEIMREGIRTGYTLHEISMWSGFNQTHSKVEDSPFYKPFLKIPCEISRVEAKAIKENASHALKEFVFPSFKKMGDFIQKEYKLHGRSGIGVNTLPNGQEFYAQVLSYYLTESQVDPQEIHQMGLKEIDRLAQEMEKVIHSLGFNMTRQEFSNYLRNNESMFFSTEKEALEAYRHTIFEVITPRLPLLFKNIPENKLTVEKVPSEAAGGTKAYYMMASADGKTPATFFLDTSSPRNLAKFEVITLSSHEGVPGHHLQVSYSMQQKNVPDFRRYDLSSSAYVEGWALYAEYLGFELGLYEDKVSLYGHYSESIFRACRMVVDTGIHAFGWTRQQAIDFMLHNSAATKNVIEREVDRYITWPGQACSYKYGEIKLKALRRKAEDALGDKFDIKEFHDVILRSSGPLELVTREVEQYIKKNCKSC